MKKLFFILFLLVILSGCTSISDKYSYNEKDVPYGNENNNDIVQRINEINLGATPNEKPTGKSNSNNQLENNMPKTNDVSNMELTDLIKEYKYALIKTDFGDIKLGFYTDESRLTVNNFLNLAQKGFYNGTKFHRVIYDFMIQGGDPLSKDDDPTNDGTGGPGFKFQDEINDHRLVKGSLAMANSGPNTNGSQFFIVTKEATPWLDGKHTNFGFVVEGMDVVMKINQIKTDANDQPLADVVINSIELEK